MTKIARKDKQFECAVSTSVEMLNSFGVELYPEVKQKWLKALRSGRYEQANGALEEDGKNCCLGVLACEEPELFDKDPYSYLPDFTFKGTDWQNEGFLPEFYMDARVQNVLSDLNDRDVSFETIANIIEECL